MAPPPAQDGRGSDFARVWLRIGALSFGGPAGQIALMHREIVEQRGWIDDASFLRALNFCMLLPGPEAQQLATWCGWRLRGVTGGLIAGGLFVLPGALLMAVLTGIYLGFGQLPLVAALLFGVQAVVIAVVAQALRRLAGRALTTPLAWAIAVGAFAALWLFDAPFPLVVAVAAVTGWAAGERGAATPAPADPASWRRTAATALLWTGIWLAPVALCALSLGPAHPLTQLGGFFVRVAAFSFGGAYAAMTYVAQAAVEARHWLAPRDMLAGLGLAETTPGPLVLVFQFVGGIAGHGFAGPWASAATGAALGMALVLWVLFVPSFLWVFALAPHLDRLSAQPGAARALAGVGAAVVGVMANLALWFALHLLFGTVVAARYGWLRWWSVSGWPNGAAIAIAVVALLMLRTRGGVGAALATGAGLGLLLALARNG